MEDLTMCMALGMVNIIIDEIFEDEETCSLEKQQNFAEQTVPNFNDRQFKEHFRLSAQTFECLLRKIHHANDRLHLIQKGRPECPIEKQTLITIWCLGNTECFR